jgi:hypothetical protein
MILRPKNWSEYQHYKDRNPPWIKLHRDLLNDRDFMCLPIASKAIAPLLWLLASEEKSGDFNANVAELAFRLRMTEKEINDGLKPLISKGFFVDASGVLADCKQLAIPETETETETEREGEGEAKAKKPKKVEKLETQVPDDFVANATAINLAKELNVSLSDEFPKFIDFHKAKGNVYKDWDAALRTWIRNSINFRKPNVSNKPVFDGRLRGAK